VELNRRTFFGIAGAGIAASYLGKASGPDWTALARGLSGTLVRPGEAAYNTARELFDPRFDTIHPAGIAYCGNPHDVATCLAFARKNRVPIAARSGGHSYAGWSSTTGLIVDVTRMDRVAVTGGTATVGAGTRLTDLYSGLAAHGRSVPGGSCPSVGVAGLTLGGGVGVVARAHGLTCDNLESVQIVTADGSLLTADARTHSDLYWACRGGGGGNFGVATEFTFRTQPAGDIVLFTLSWPWSRAAEVVRAWQSWAPHAPDALWSNLHLAATPGRATPTIQVGGSYLGSISGAHNQIEKLYDAAGSDATGYFLQQYAYLEAMNIEAGGPAHRQPQYAKSDFFTRPLNSGGIGTLLRNVQRLTTVQGAAGGVGGVAFDALGGAVNRIGAGDTAFVHRDALFLAQYTTDWTAGADAGRVQNQYEWLASFWKNMRPYASGQAYQNYIDPALPNWRQAYYGANYARLARVKTTYDPQRLFSFPQAVLRGQACLGDDLTHLGEGVAEFLGADVRPHRDHDREPVGERLPQQPAHGEAEPGRPVVGDLNLDDHVLLLPLKKLVLSRSYVRSVRAGSGPDVDAGVHRVAVDRTELVLGQLGPVHGREVLLELGDAGGADQRGGHPAVAQHPLDRELGEALAAVRRDLVEPAQVGECLLGELVL
jgi:FAD/FMN-containing dehydrogenase